MKIGIFHATAGYGHKKVAESIEKTLTQEISSTDEVRLEDSLDYIHPILSNSYKQFYYQSVKHFPWLWGTGYELLDDFDIYRLIASLRSFWNKINGAKLLREIKNWEPDVLVSTHFFSSELFGAAKKRGEIASKLITVVTDFYPHNFWIQKATDIYCVMSEEGRDDLIQRGVEAQKIKITGIPIDQKFSEKFNQAEILNQNSLERERLTILLTSGSFGLGSPKELLDSLSPFKNKIQAFLVCGRNESAYKELKNERFAFPVKVLGFTDEMHKLMGASDVLVAKPGGSTTSEALSLGLPMFLLDPIPGQETGNAKVLLDRDACFALRDIKELPNFIGSILENLSVLDVKKKNIQKLAKPNATNDVVRIILDKEEVHG